MEEKLNKWKTTSKKNVRQPQQKLKSTLKNKMEDEPINQNQPNWLCDTIVNSPSSIWLRFC